MARISFYEKLKKRKINIDDEAIKLNKIIHCEYFREDASTLFKYLDDKLGYFDSSEFIRLYQGGTNAFYDLENYLDCVDFYLLFYSAYEKAPKSAKYHINIDFISIMQGVSFVLDKLGYQIINNKEGRYIIVQKDAVAEEVAGLSSVSDIKWRILEYNAYKTTIEDKKAILLELYKKFEEIRSELLKNNKDIANRLGELFNLLRHKKDKKKETKYSFFYQDEEEWCDKTYDLLLEAFLHIENKKILEELNHLIKEKKQ